MTSRLRCWLNGHPWGEWEPEVWQNLFGTEYRVRFCKQCGAMQRRLR